MNNIHNIIKQKVARALTSEEIDGMRVAGAMAAQTLEMISEFVTAGVSTETLDDICHKYITQELGAIPAPLNYKGFPKSICTSINDVICHGIPSKKDILHKGDIVNIDVTVLYDGWHGDTSYTFLIGKCAQHVEKLVAVTQESMYLGIAQAKVGNTLGDVGYAIQKHALSHNYGIVREYCGHGIGRIFHDEPQVFHYGRPGTGLPLTKGMTFTIEPMLVAGSPASKIMPDGWTVRTENRRNSAQWEHTIMVTDDEPEVFTKRANEVIPIS